MQGKLIIKAYVLLKPVDEHGREVGKWVTVLTQHALNLESADLAATEFISLNSHLGTCGINATFVPYPTNIF